MAVKVHVGDYSGKAKAKEQYSFYRQQSSLTRGGIQRHDLSLSLSSCVAWLSRLARLLKANVLNELPVKVTRVIEFDVADNWRSVFQAA